MTVRNKRQGWVRAQVEGDKKRTSKVKSLGPKTLRRLNQSILVGIHGTRKKDKRRVGRTVPCATNGHGQQSHPQRHKKHSSPRGVRSNHPSFNTRLMLAPSQKKDRKSRRKMKGSIEVQYSKENLSEKDGAGRNLVH